MKLIEYIRFAFYLVLLLPAMPGLIKQGKYEEQVQRGEIG